MYLVRPMMRPPMGLPLPMPRGGPMDGHYRFPPQGQVMMSGPPSGMSRPQMHIGLGSRGPLPGGHMVLGRMPGIPPAGIHPQQSVLVMQRPGVPIGHNGAPMIRQQIRPGPPGFFEMNALFPIMLFSPLFRRSCLAQCHAWYAWSTSTQLLSRSTGTRRRFLLFDSQQTMDLH